MAEPSLNEFESPEKSLPQKEPYKHRGRKLSARKNTDAGREEIDVCGSYQIR